VYVIPGHSAPPYDLKAIFRKWDDKAWPFKSSKITTIDLEDAFNMLERETYCIKELQGDCLPLGVNANQLEVQFPSYNAEA
jgi:hypothetical protein